MSLAVPLDQDQRAQGREHSRQHFASIVTDGKYAGNEPVGGGRQDERKQHDFPVFIHSVVERVVIRLTSGLSPLKAESLDDSIRRRGQLDLAGVGRADIRDPGVDDIAHDFSGLGGIAETFDCNVDVLADEGRQSSTESVHDASGEQQRNQQIAHNFPCFFVQFKHPIIHRRSFSLDVNSSVRQSPKAGNPCGNLLT